MSGDSIHPPIGNAGVAAQIRDYREALAGDASPLEAPSDVEHCLRLIQRVRSHEKGADDDRSKVPGRDEPVRGPGFDTAGAQSDETKLPGWPEPWQRFDARQQIGRFAIERKLGEGGCGVVFLANDPRVNRRVALKVPNIGVLVQSDLMHRFLREGEAAAALDHPHIVPVYEAGQVGAVNYIASGYVEGESLAEWLSRHAGPVEPTAAARLVAALTDAVQHAHSRGVLHRDLKPSNVMLEGSSKQAASPLSASELASVVKLTDFGLAKLLEAEPRDGDTLSQAIVGTPAYMSPEQAEGRNRDVGTAADVYALGTILYELLAGQRPFVRESHVATLKAVCSEEPVAPSRRVPGVPADLEAICLKCLEKPIHNRYATAAALADDLHRYLTGENVTARALGRSERLRRWCLRNPRVAVLSALSGLLALSLLVGSLIATWLVSKAHDSTLEHLAAETKALAAETRAREEAKAHARRATQSEFRSIVARVELALDSGIPGQKTESLKALQRGAEIVAELKLGERERFRLRTLAVNCLSLPDVGSRRMWPAAASRFLFDIDGRFKNYTDHSRKKIFVRQVSDHRVIAEFKPERPRVDFVRISPDGKHVVAQSRDRQARRSLLEIWSVNSRKRLHRSDLPESTFSRIFDFNHNGDRFAVLRENGDCDILNARDFTRLSQISFRNTALMHLRLSPDGRYVAGLQFDRRTRRYRLTVIEVNGGIVRHGLAVDASQVIQDVEWSPRGRRIAFATRSGSVLVWEVSKRSVQRTLTIPNVGLNGVGWHPDGRWIAIASSDGQTRVWDVDTGRRALKFDGRFTRFQYDGKAIGGPSGTIRFSPPLGHHTVQLPPGTAGEPHFATGDSLLAAGRDRLVAVDCNTGMLLTNQIIRGLTRLAVSPDGQTAYFGLPDRIECRQIFRPDPNGVLEFQPGRVIRLENAVPDHLDASTGRLFGRIVNRETRKMDLVSIRMPLGESRRLPIGLGRRPRIVINKHGDRFAVLEPATHKIQIWNAGTGKRDTSISSSSGNRNAAFHPNGRQLAVVTAGRCAVFTLKDKTVAFQDSTERHQRVTTAVSYSPEGRLLAYAISPNSVRIVETGTWKPLWNLKCLSDSGVRHLKFSMDSRILLANLADREQPIHIWQLGRIQAEMQELGLVAR